MDKKEVVVPLTATLAVQAFVSMAAVTVPVFAQTASEDIGISASYVGIYVGLIYAACMASSLLGGGFILRYGALRVSQLCLVLAGIGLCLATVTHVPVLIISALILGLGYGPVTPASSHILIRSTPSHLVSFIFSLKQTGVPIGGAMAGAIVPPLVLYAGWKFSALVVGFLCLLLAFSLQPLRTGIDDDRHARRPISFTGVLKPIQLVLANRALLQLSIISFSYAAMQISLITYLVIYLSEHIGMTLIAAGLILSAGQLGGSVARIVWGLIADRYVKPRLLIGIIGICMSLCAVATAFFSSTWHHTLIMGVIILYGATAIGWNGVYVAEAARLAPEGQVGMATGGTLVFTFLGVVVGPPVFAAIINTTNSYPSAFIVFAGLTFISGTAAMITGTKAQTTKEQ